jgi:hypothetical protein
VKALVEFSVEDCVIYYSFCLTLRALIGKGRKSNNEGRKVLSTRWRSDYRAPNNVIAQLSLLYDSRPTAARQPPNSRLDSRLNSRPFFAGNSANAYELKRIKKLKGFISFYYELAEFPAKNGRLLRRLSRRLLGGCRAAVGRLSY